MGKTIHFSMGIVISLLLLFTSGPLAQGANPTQPLNTVKEGINIAKDVIVAITMPHTLKIGQFTITDVSYLIPNAENATGRGKTAFTTGANFEVNFSGVRITNITGPNGVGTISDGTVTGSPNIVVTIGGLPIKVKKVKITPGTVLTDLDITLPTLWSRQNNSLPKKAVLSLEEIPSKHNLEIFENSIQGHNLGELGVGDTNIIIDCTASLLTLDLSANQTALPDIDKTKIGILFNQISTKKQPALKDCNTGFCFGKYTAANAFLSATGLQADLELEETFTYNTSLPKGYQITLNPNKAPASQQINLEATPELNTATGSLSSNLSQKKVEFDFSKVPLSADLKHRASQLQKYKINLNLLEGVQIKPYYQSALIINESSITTGVFSGTIRFPESVFKFTGEPIEAPFTKFSVDHKLNMQGSLPYNAPICWSKFDGQVYPRYGIWPRWQDGYCFFPGADPQTFSFTTIDSSNQTEIFNKPNIQSLPGVTFYYFDLAIGTLDARIDQLNLNALIIPSVIPPAVEQAYKEQTGLSLAIFRGDTWINISTAGVSGKMEVESAIGYRDYPVYLGNPIAGSEPFKTYLHAIPDPNNPETNYLWGLYEHLSGPEGKRVWGPFFRATFVDGAVFDLGVDGHIEVKGPSNFLAGIKNLSATSTGELTSAKIAVNADLEYWGVNLNTNGAQDASRLVPRVSQAFFLGAEINEKKHYENAFPVVWGRMNGGGNISDFIFGYRSQYFDRLPYTYRNVCLSKYDPYNQGSIRGAIVTEGDIYFPFFGAQKMEIYDYKDITPNLDLNYEGRKISLYNNPDYSFELKKTWGHSNTSAEFLFPHVRYFDGTEYEDGFGHPLPSNNLPFSDEWQVKINNYEKPLASNLHITGTQGVLINVRDNNPNAIIQSGTCSGNPEPVKLNGINGDVAITFENQDTLPELKLKGRFVNTSPLVGGFAGNSNPECDITVRPTLSPFEIEAPLNLDAGPIKMSSGDSKAKLSVLFDGNAFDGTITLTGVDLKAGETKLGSGSGAFNIHLAGDAKYLQGAANMTIYGLPLINSGAGAMFVGYGAKKEAVFALDYIDGSIRQNMLDDINTISGFYIACRLGYNCGLISPFGEAHVYLFGGTGIFFLPEQHQYDYRLLFHGGANVGVEILECGVDATAKLQGRMDTNLNNLSSPGLDFKATGSIAFTVSLLFVDFSWTGQAAITKDGFQLF
ncbi:MAG TPA: hypothetical protein VHY08_23115 [Bacillota bacterium]|nr:hypothetical protein [Bacillota bacterium]